MKDQSWNSGLDVIRAVNTLLVVVGHIIFLFPFDAKLNLWRLTIPTYYSVELLFVLSGFLIGRILIREFVIKENESTTSTLLNFYMRRWLRTLPLYYLLLFFHVTFWNYVGYLPFYNPQVLHWQHFFFLQHLNPEASGTFPEAWSLALEEWFYFTFPLAIIGLQKFRKKFTTKDIEKFVWVIIVGMLLLRVIYVYHWNTGYDFWIRKNVFLRMDSVAFGVWCAYLSLYKPDFFAKLGSKFSFGTSIISLFFLSIYFIHITIAGLDKDFFARTLMFSLVSACGVPMVSYCYHTKFTPSRFIAHMSLLSPGTYVTHLTCIVIGAHYAAQVADSYLFWVYLAASIVGIFAVPPILYRFYEKPCLDLRKHISPAKISLFLKKFNCFSDKKLKS